MSDPQAVSATGRAPHSKPPSPQPAETVTVAGYETFYGLHEAPFSLTWDLRFLYHSAAHDRATQTMLDAIRRRDGIVVLMGEMGMGKTILCRAVMEQLDRRTLTSFVADPFLTPEELLKNVLVDFGVISQAERSVGHLSEASLADLSAALRDFLYSLAPLQAFAVVIIDEAQGLSVELLRQICALADIGGDEQLLQLVLVGQPSLSVKLAKSELRLLFKRVAARATLGPLTADEVPEYVAHRLHVAGPSARVEFDAAATGQIHALSGGVPRIVNQLSDRALAAGHQESASTIDEELVRRAAEDLDLVPHGTNTSSALRTAAVAVAFGLLVLVGAAAGAYIFRSDVAVLIDRWQGRPMPPLPPLEFPTPSLPPPTPVEPAADKPRP